VGVGRGRGGGGSLRCDGERGEGLWEGMEGKTDGVYGGNERNERWVVMLSLESEDAERMDIGL